jgi:uncharacterized protein
LPQRTGAVTDQADILADSDERSLSDWSRRTREKTGTELAVVTLVSLQRQPIEAWGRALGESWSVGGNTANGIILIVAPFDREVRIEVGDGVGSNFSDGVAASIIRNVMIPKFKEGRMAAGTAAGVFAIADALAPDVVTIEEPASNATWQMPPIVGLAVVAIAIPFLILLVASAYRVMRDAFSDAAAHTGAMRDSDQRVERTMREPSVLWGFDDDDRRSGPTVGRSPSIFGSRSLGGSWGSRGSSGAWSSGGGRSSGGFGGGGRSSGSSGGGRGSSGKW